MSALPLCLSLGGLKTSSHLFHTDGDERWDLALSQGTDPGIHPHAPNPTITSASELGLNNVTSDRMYFTHIWTQYILCAVVDLYLFSDIHNCGFKIQLFPLATGGIIDFILEMLTAKKNAQRLL